MHKLMDYICTELEDLERKVDRGDSLTMAEVQYADTLLRMKKNLLKSEELTEGYSNGYSRDYSNARGRGTNARRDSRGRYADGYSRSSMVETIRDMMDDAPDEATRSELQRFVEKFDRR